MYFNSLLPIISCLVITSGEDSFKDFTEPMKECYRKVTESLNRCQEEVAKQWNCAITGQQTVELSCGQGEGRTCCPLWFLFRCHQTHIKEQCGDDLLKEFNRTLFDPQIKQIDDNDCTQYKYSSNRCQQLLDLDLNAIVVPGEAPAKEPQYPDLQTTPADMPTDSARLDSKPKLTNFGCTLTSDRLMTLSCIPVILFFIQNFAHL